MLLLEVLKNIANLENLVLIILGAFNIHLIIILKSLNFWRLFHFSFRFQRWLSSILIMLACGIPLLRLASSAGGNSTFISLIILLKYPLLANI